jgi:hypothetical protein
MDRIIILFIFIPLIRKELAEFILDKNKAYYVIGVLNNLYN